MNKNSVKNIRRFFYGSYRGRCVDAVGKGTQIQMLKEAFEKNGKAVHIVHYSSIKQPDSAVYNIQMLSKILYKDMFRLINEATNNDDRVLILDRAHLGEIVYSEMYRDYSGRYVLHLEDDLSMLDQLRSRLILFTDDAEKIIERDKARGDGLSFSLDIDKKKQELRLFDEAFDLSSFDNKKRIELKGRTAEQLFKEEVEPFVFGIGVHK